MIARLTGTVLTIGATSAVIDLSGFGVLVQVTPGTAGGLRLGQPTTLSTSLVVREDSLTLYGFADDSGRDLFELLITANGVGPKLAQAALAVHEPDQLRAAIAGGDLAALTRVPGIGKRGAEKIVVELRDKVNALGPVGDLPAASGGGAEPEEAWRSQVSSGLQGLGWSAKDAAAACERIEPVVAAEPDTPIAVLMRAALQSLARQ
ncbi:Holliday junction branch migration protein RuvA [Propionibacteriaceae bacterium Y2011]|uniref:Holliday junction branch migration protein RuvA n=1 Tax=Microlunatus sp. Y2014 TaxID=3418488 RepID=UPI003B45FEAD